jgi:hypothetical protein
VLQIFKFIFVLYHGSHSQHAGGVNFTHPRTPDPSSSPVSESREIPSCAWNRNAKNIPTAVPSTVISRIAMDATKRHFPERHYDGSASGPFALLNPTVRRFPLAVPKPDAQSSDSSQVKDTDAQHRTELPSTAAGEEVRAEDVQRQWRSRDNRKGKWSC